MENDSSNRIPYHPPHRWSGMPDREVGHGIIYQQSDLERSISRAVAEAFKYFFDCPPPSSEQPRLMERASKK